MLFKVARKDARHGEFQGACNMLSIAIPILSPQPDKAMPPMV